MDVNTPIILLHGLGPGWIQSYFLMPCAYWLQWNLGFKNIHRIVYPTKDTEFQEMLESVSASLEKIVSKDKPIIVIGASMGGVVANNLHTKGWNISKAIYVGSPLHGARMLNTAEAYLPTMIRDALFKPAYGYLMDKKREDVPPHKYHTISMSLPFTEFDLCVHRDEATLEDEYHTHLPFSTHQFVWFNPRLWSTISQQLSVSST
jgi:pimeloyl-ACP methyl ester carboxylesterase